MTYLSTESELDALFGPVGEASRVKETPRLSAAYRQWIQRSPFAVLATVGPGGLDASPRGDPAPLVRIVDDQTLLLPERRGNNRVDSLRNLLHDPRMALIFFVPGVRETLRVNGRARIGTDPALLAALAMQGQAPKCVLEIAIDSVFFQCARAVQRASLWSADHASAGEVPTPGQMLAELSAGGIDGQRYDGELPARQAATLY
ncbi:MAG: pyridoxamine 5'-phosphate oxidase family protein [Hydrogenophaga sp.]|uniref:pyridoxamine 5'-phosphate oxidase family protein n=1 Tax=Hydrogenophaga sp. TaxID=1904254 RepID=UPI001D5990B2|nr:pyridoxamine 5'-phosphate oxidase family protein [Hydrogenophaga sp.]MBX3610012.1 pyridoxamine 5'-phosphate oxidase family protein [Hydrogenophaga sp.]